MTLDTLGVNPIKSSSPNSAAIIAAIISNFRLFSQEYFNNLAVDALNGAPGIYSARFAGEQRSDADNNAKVLRLMETVADADRTARFFCVIAIVLPDGREYTVEGTCEGTILHALRGEGGFGYDPLFYVESMNKTFAELTMEEKNRISHRGHANRKAVEIIRGLKSE